VVKVAQSATATWPNPCHISFKVDSGTFLKERKFCKGVFLKKNCNDQNQNWLYLQRPNAYLCLKVPILIKIYHSFVFLSK